jgi:rSAM/selenodomain-associated transferase 1
MTMPASAPQKGCAIAVMAKAPRPGQVKTRLVPPLTAPAAAALSASFLGDITRNIALAAEQAPIRGYVAFAPAGHETLFDGMLAPGTGLVLADGTGDMPERVQGFGRSLVHAVQALFARGHDSVCLLNSDSPTLPTVLLAQAARALAAAGDRVVLGPADDGGYYLIGLKAPHWHLFEDIAWSTDQVADQTRARARTLGLDLVELASWYDVDDRDALRRLLNEFAGVTAGALTPYHAPATRECAAIQRLSDLFGPDDHAETLLALRRNR